VTDTVEAAPRPRLSWDCEPDAAGAVALVLHGGKSASFDPTDAGQLTAVRMRPFSRALAEAGAPDRLAVASIGYRYRGWNGEHASPVPDARWGLEQIRERYGDVAIVLVGHSMGGRTALRIADDSSVRAVLALAPWLPDGEPVAAPAGLPVLIAHGSWDKMTSPAGSRRWAERARRAGVDVCRLRVRAEMHPMIFRPHVWHRLAVGFTLGALGFAEMPGEVRRACKAAKNGDFDVAL
jgi:dienelactone hydrolase